jgi:hypothetical protein
MTESLAREAENDEMGSSPDIRVEDMFIALGHAEPAPPRPADAD